MEYMTKMDMLATFCIFFFVALESESTSNTDTFYTDTFYTDATSNIAGFRDHDSLAELGVNGQHLGVTNEGKRQDGYGVRRL